MNKKLSCLISWFKKDSVKPSIETDSAKPSNEKEAKKE